MSKSKIDESKIDSSIILDRAGKILEGKRKGGFVKVQFDPDVGFYIFESNSPLFNSPETYDGWAKDEEHLNHFFKSTGWVVEWLPDLKVEQTAE